MFTKKIRNFLDKQIQMLLYKSSEMSKNMLPVSCALNGGEDYELLFTIDQKDYEKIQTMSADVTVIGYMTDDKGVAEMITPDNHVIPIKAQGWDHMRKNNDQ